ncbi:methionyl-tRNA formyltransferase [Micrococcus luteus]|nr:methionyl-tRNA formyltransferase [Micrococcus luteus]MCK6060832.1 methionyl-tRNA formyltransferase [Micrococcus luteus]MCK6062725.1 methionyl-tRNA formyltransferase [Micrococcus luteus]MCK6063154.1 methionyl-tRNA formyltransferase [Micrococcus luteus]MCK6191274.1 methionyl-tRNA formyltransferase [Micrococcus luteus]
MTTPTPLRVLYAGTPETAVPVLRALLDSPHEVVGVLTRPDAPVGRRRVLTPSPVGDVAEEAGLPVLKADRLRGPEGADALQTIRALEADVAVVVAYGALVPAEALEIPRHGWLNLHFSALPSYRGAAPVQRAVMAGETEIAADVFQLEEGLDTGPVFARLTRPVAADETAGAVLADLAERGGPLVIGVLDRLAAGTATATPQHGEPSQAPKLSAVDGLVDPARPVAEVAARINGVTPEPGAWGWLVVDDGAAPTRFKLDGVAPVRAGDDDWPSVLDAADPGAILVAAKAAWLRTADGAARLSRVQPAGRKLMPAADWVRGATAGAALLAGEELADHEAQVSQEAAARAAAREAARNAAAQDEEARA